MAKTYGRRTGRAATRLAAAAITAALVGTGTAAFAAEPGDAPMSGLAGLDSAGTSYYYAPAGSGGIEKRVQLDTGWKNVKFLGRVDHNADNVADGRWQLAANGDIHYYANDNSAAKKIGYGWGIYNKLVSPGTFGGAQGGDLLARDGKGDLYLYLGYGDGTVTKRLKVGYGWNIYSDIAGNGDLTGDGRNDIVARDKSGVLWLYKGTGNQHAPYAKRTRIGSGWNQYNAVFAPGDLDLDGVADLVARNAKGELYLYKGTGKAAAPYKPKAIIGTSGWNTYRLFF